MKKKRLIVSAIVAAVVVFASFTSVIGIQARDGSVKDSPLFGIRTQESINSNIEEEAVLAYIGKGKNILNIESSIIYKCNDILPLIAGICNDNDEKGRK